MSREEEKEYIFIPDDEGNDEKFEILYEFETDEGVKYLLLTPSDTPEDSDEEEVYPFRYEEIGDELKLYPVEDEEEWEMIEEVLNTLDFEFNQ